MIEALSEEQWRSWEDQGYVRLGVQLSAAEVAELQRRCDDLMMGTADDVDFSMLRMVREKPEGGIRDGIGQDIGHRGATLEYSKFQGLEHDPVFHRLMSQPLMRCVCPAAVPALTASETVAIYPSRCCGTDTRLHCALQKHVPRRACIWIGGICSGLQGDGIQQTSGVRRQQDRLAVGPSSHVHAT
jgi:hypothetical protein